MQEKIGLTAADFGERLKPTAFVSKVTVMPATAVPAPAPTFYSSRLMRDPDFEKGWNTRMADEPFDFKASKRWQLGWKACKRYDGSLRLADAGIPSWDFKL